MSKSVGAFLVMISAAMWGISGVFGQFLFEHYHPDPVWLILVRQLAAGILFLLYSSLNGEPVLKLWNSGRRNVKETLWFTLGLLGAQFLFYYTISIANAILSQMRLWFRINPPRAEKHQNGVFWHRFPRISTYFAPLRRAM